MKKLLNIVFMVTLNLGLSAQVLLTAEASRYKVGVGETFTVTFKINGNAGDFDYPDFTGFKVVSGPMTSMSTTIVNGKMSQERSAAFDLIALKIGTFTIGAAKVKADGKIFQSKPLTITVVEKTDKPANSLEAKAAELASVKILTNKRSVYVGEPISTRYTLVLKTNVGNFDLLEEPDYQGFIKNDIDLKRYETKEEVLGGERVTTADIAKFVLVPQKPGKLNPGTLRLRLPTSVPTGRRDWFGQREMRTVNQITESAFPELEVKPLPANKPTGFSGGVGEFKLYVDLSRNEVNADESITLTIEVAGKGNLQLVELPKPQLPNSIESYEPKYKENISVKTSGISGYKRHEYLLVPRFRGTYKIPVLRFTFFDTEKEEYITLTSEPLEINVAEGPQATNQPGTTPVNSDKTNVTAVGEDILFIHTTPSAFAKAHNSFFTNNWHLVFIGLLILILLGGYGYYHFRQSYTPDVVAQTKRKAARKAEKRINGAKPMIGANKVKEFYGELTAAIQDYFEEKFGLAIADFTADSVSEVVSKNGGEEQLASEVKHIINQADMARFAPLTQANMQRDFEKAQEVINKLEKLS